MHLAQPGSPSPQNRSCPQLVHFASLQFSLGFSFLLTSPSRAIKRGPQLLRCSGAPARLLVEELAQRPMDHEDGKGDAAQELATAMQSQGKGLMMEPSGLMLVGECFMLKSDYCGGSLVG